jgi:endonuclease G
MLERKLINRLLDGLLRVPGADDRSTRNAILRGIPTAALNRADNAYADFSQVITQLDGLGRLENGERPVLILADNASHMTRGTELGKLLEDLKEEIERDYAGERPLADLPTQPEALIFGGGGEWVTATFLEQARLVGTRVARLRVPRIIEDREDGPVGGVGTGWLIAPGLLLTNHHVVNARAQGEPDARRKDFIAQARRTVAWFDYYAEGGSKAEVRAAELLADDPELDYALLRLEDDAAARNREAIALPQKAPKLQKGMRLNIVQCPAGGPLRFAIRNNFFVGHGRQQHQIRYLTDTLEGSSGSPVMDDRWQVIALHHGATKIDPKLYQGEPGLQGVVKYHNQGIDIQRIVAHLPEALSAEIKRAHGWG